MLNLLTAVVTDEQGERAWDDLLDRAGVDGAYTAHGTYPDADLTALLAGLDTDLAPSPQERLRWFGRSAMPMMRASYPRFFEPHEHTADFLRTLNDLIHPAVRRLYPGADVPVFDVDEADTRTDRIALGYRSHRRLCALAEGFVLGAAAEYGETCALRQDVCMLRGDDLCVIVATFEPAAPHPPDPS